MATYRRGSSGDGVRNLQMQLNQNGANITVDGIYGSATENAVRNYQRQKGLSVDGIAGNQTLSALSGGGASSAPAASAPKSAAQQLAEFTATQPKAYQSNYQSQIDALLQQIQNREPFQYDFASDPLYQQYAQRYQDQGKLAMQDTMGQAASLTGGYGNSYAQSVGQQQYNQYLKGLNDVIPDLRDSAYQMYENEGDDMERRLALYRQQEGDDYDRYMDAYNQWQNERNYLYQLAQDEEEKRRWEAEYALSQQAARSSGGGGSGGSGRRSSGSSGGGGNSGLSSSALNAFADNLEANVKSKTTYDAMRNYYTSQIASNSNLSQTQKNELMAYFQSNVRSWYNAMKAARRKKM